MHFDPFLTGRGHSHSFSFHLCPGAILHRDAADQQLRPFPDLCPPLPTSARQMWDQVVGGRELTSAHLCPPTYRGRGQRAEVNPTHPQGYPHA